MGIVSRLVALVGEVGDEIFALGPAPAGRNSDAVFLVDRMTKLAGEKLLWLRTGVHEPRWIAPF